MTDLPLPESISWRDLSGDEVYHIAHLENEARDDIAELRNKALITPDFYSEYTDAAQELLMRTEALVTGWIIDKALAKTSFEYQDVESDEITITSDEMGGSAETEIDRTKSEEFCALVARLAKTRLKPRNIDELLLDPINRSLGKVTTDHYEDNYEVEEHIVDVKRDVNIGNDNSLDSYKVRLSTRELLDDNRRMITWETFEINVELESKGMNYIPRYEKKIVIHNKDKGTVDTGKQEEQTLREQAELVEPFDPDQAAELRKKARESIHEKMRLKDSTGELYFSNQRYERIMQILTQIESEQ